MYFCYNLTFIISKQKYQMTLTNVSLTSAPNFSDKKQSLFKLPIIFTLMMIAVIIIRFIGISITDSIAVF